MKKVLKKSKVDEFLAKLGEEAAVLAPVEREGEIFFAVPGKDTPVTLDFANTRNAPKAAFFPKTETMYKYDRRDKMLEITEAECEGKPQVLFAVRPCDAKSFAILDRLFINEDFVDPYYEVKRKASTVFVLGCSNPCATCFCTSLDCGPFHSEDADVFMTDLGDALLLEAEGEKGAQAIGNLPDAKGDELQKKEALAGEAAEKISTKIDINGLPKKLTTIFEDPVWSEISERCLACGTCTYLCPTCHCFDIQDEISKSGGQRVRNWDSCMFSLFTLHGSWHNPRTQQNQRWRQRLQHKFNYYVENFGCTACVGCGRCITNCPVKIDIREILGRIIELEKVKEGT